MNRLKAWIICKYLPAFARAALEEEIERLNELTRRQEVELIKRQAYINGLLEGQKAARRIVIQNKA